MGEVGRRWRRTLHDETVFGHYSGQAMFSVAAGGPGFVAVGEELEVGAAAVWTSPDGAVWQRVAHDEAVFGGPGEQVMFSVAVGGPGLVAVGNDRGQGTAAVWTSTDGAVWQRVAHDEAVFGGPRGVMMSSVAAGGPGLVAVGWEDAGQNQAAVWTSPDGAVWQRVAHDERAFPDSVMFSVAAGGPGLVAVGIHAGQASSPAAAVWTSTDGAVWQRLAHDEAVFGGPGPGPVAMNSVAAGGPGLVAVGNDWGQGVAAVWTSTDGAVWQRVAHDEEVFGGPGPVAMSSVAAGGPGLVAVGQELEVGPAAVWTSPDGAVWQRLAHDEAVFGDPDGVMMSSVAAGGPGLVAVGLDYGLNTAAVWVSPAASRLQGAR